MLRLHVLISNTLQVDNARQSPYSNLRGTKSYDASQARRQSQTNGMNGQSSQQSLPNSQKENPFDRGYEEYNISAEAVNYAGSTEHDKSSFESSLASPSLHGMQGSSNSTRVSSPLRETAGTTLSPQRSPLRSSFTMPSRNDDLGLGHNAWADADEDDPDFGKEQEVKLTF